MRRVLTDEDAIKRPYLVEYDPRNPSPNFTPEQIRYVESRQHGLSKADVEKLDSIEFFVKNTLFPHIPGLTACAVPGLRLRPGVDVRYVKRFSADPYLVMMNRFLDFVPADFPVNQIDRCHFPSYRLTSPDGSQFYPIEFNGDLKAWRKRLSDSAKEFCTLVGYIEGGKFVVSSGERLSFVDLTIDWLAHGDSSADF